MVTWRAVRVEGGGWGCGPGQRVGSGCCGAVGSESATPGPSDQPVGMEEGEQEVKHLISHETCMYVDMYIM